MASAALAAPLGRDDPAGAAAAEGPGLAAAGVSALPTELTGPSLPVVAGEAAEDDVGDDPAAGAFDGASEPGAADAPPEPPLAVGNGAALGAVVAPGVGVFVAPGPGVGPIVGADEGVGVFVEAGVGPGGRVGGGVGATVGTAVGTGEADGAAPTMTVRVMFGCASQTPRNVPGVEKVLGHDQEPVLGVSGQAAWPAQWMLWGLELPVCETVTVSPATIVSTSGLKAFPSVTTE